MKSGRDIINESRSIDGIYFEDVNCKSRQKLSFRSLWFTMGECGHDYEGKHTVGIGPRRMTLAYVQNSNSIVSRV